MAFLVLAGPDRAGQRRMYFDFAYDPFEMLAALTAAEKINPAVCQMCYRLIMV
jgi:hypothetical protein